MLYITSKFHEDSVNTIGFLEGGLLKPPPPELRKSPGGRELSIQIFQKQGESGPIHFVFYVDSQ